LCSLARARDYATYSARLVRRERGSWIWGFGLDGVVSWEHGRPARQGQGGDGYIGGGLCLLDVWRVLGSLCLGRTCVFLETDGLGCDCDVYGLI
jgi:hypothetical protein